MDTATEDNVMEWNCPKCGSTNLRVATLTWVALIQHENGEFETSLLSSDHEWDGNSCMQCCECNHADAADSFNQQLFDDWIKANSVFAFNY